MAENQDTIDQIKSTAEDSASKLAEIEKMMEDNQRNVMTAYLRTFFNHPQTKPAFNQKIQNAMDALKED
jgi:hypothetical protein